MYWILVYYCLQIRKDTNYSTSSLGKKQFIYCDAQIHCPPRYPGCNEFAHRSRNSTEMRKFIAPLVTRGTIDLRVAVDKLSPWPEILSLARLQHDLELASLTRIYSSIQNKRSYSSIQNKLTTSHIYNLVKTRGIYGFFSNLVSSNIK